MDSPFAKVTTVVELKDGRKFTFTCDEPLLSFNVRTDVASMDIDGYLMRYPMPGRTLEVHYTVMPSVLRKEIEFSEEIPPVGPILTGGS